MSKNNDNHLQDQAKPENNEQSEEIQNMQNAMKPFLGASTLGLMNDLEESDDFNEFLEKNVNSLISSPLSTYIEKIIENKKFKRAEVIRKANLDRVYGFQIIKGKRMPSREKLIQLGFGMELNPIEMNSLLKFAGYLPLFVKDIRDAAILFCLNNGYSLFQTQEMLVENDLTPIGDK